MKLLVSESKIYGRMRHVLLNGEVLFLGSDVIHSLGFTNKGILTDCVDEDDRREIDITESETGRSVKEIMINLYGVQSLIAACNNKVNIKPFKAWLIHDIASGYHTSTKSKREICTTKDYTKFKHLEGNRDTLQ